MKGKSLIAGIIIIILAASSLLLWISSGQKLQELHRFGFFKKFDDYLVINHDQSLIWFNQEGKVDKIFDFKAIGIIKVLDYDFFSNGDVLIYNQQEPASFTSNLARFFRLSQEPEFQTSQAYGESGFYRCNLVNPKCAPWGVNLPVKASTLRIAVDRITNQVYISIANAHKIYHIDEKGSLLSTVTELEMRFPNQIHYQEDGLWVIDTNNQRLFKYKNDEVGLSVIQDQIKTQRHNKSNWPHQFAFTQDGAWINIAEASMGNGKVVHYSHAGDILSEAQLQYISDPLSIALWNERLWVADFEQTRIEMLNSEGQPLGLLEIPELQQKVEQNNQIKNSATDLKFFGLAGAVLTFLFGFSAAYVLEKKESKEVLSGQFNNDSLSELQKKYAGHNAEEIFWFKNKLKDKLKLIYGAWTSLLAIAIATIFMVIKDIADAYYIIPGLIVFSLLILLSLHNSINNLFGLSLGIKKDIVFIEGKNFKEQISLHDIKFNMVSFYTAKATILSGQRGYSPFNKLDMERYILSQLDPKNQMNEFATYKFLWQRKDPVFLVGLITLICSGIGFLIANYLS